MSFRAGWVWFVQRSIGPAIGLFGILLPGAAHAQFAVCNQSFDVVNVAIGLDLDDSAEGVGQWQTEGWWTIGPNQCANVVRDELKSRYIYLHAQDVFGQPLLTGTTQMCVSPRRFVITGLQDCWSRGYVAARFIEIDTLKTQRWTLFLGAQP